MKKSYYVEVTISGCVMVSADSETDAQEMVNNAVSNEKLEKEILEDIGNMLGRHLDDGNVDIGTAFPADDC